MADAVRALKKRKGALITYWDLSKYLSGHVVAEDDARARRDQRDGFVHTFDKAMRDEFFWAYLDSWFKFSARTLAFSKSKRFALDLFWSQS